jgi:hypothetical protein
MTKNIQTRDEIARKIAAVMVESPDPENPNLEHNAYNWGLAHAELLFNGVTVESIKAMQPK